ncbi:hypothetical protein [Spiroplasma endosymbiont of Nebria brevicollis]|uniref:hypothetical protein n=1 Tax=Spiroplasma endosymbiont of Nebria brevicollis TaxID=3066284 RepID=UPI00313EDE44
MPKQRKELGNYKEKIQEYLRTNKDNLKKCTKQELNYILKVDNKYIFDCRRRPTKWQKDFINEYDKACLKIGIARLKNVTKVAQYEWLYLRTNHRDMFDDLIDNQDVETNNSNIIINITEPRKIENNN